MKLSRRRFISITAGFAAGAAMPPALAAETVAWRGTALGASVRMVIAGRSESEAGRLVDLARAEIGRLETIFSIYRPDGSVGRLNRFGLVADPPPELLRLLSIVRTVHDRTSGLFDPTVQPLWAAYAQSGGRPSDSQIAAALQLVGWSGVKFDESHVRLARQGMQLTLNGIAQGFITDRVAGLLRSQGLADAIVDIGEIAALGQHPGGVPWRIGLAARSDLPADGHVGLPDGLSLATSSTYGTRFASGAGHILDPRDGLPATPSWERVTIMHPSAAVADGLSTAAAMMDEKRLTRLAREVPAVGIVAKRSDGSVLVRESSAG